MEDVKTGKRAKNGKIVSSIEPYKTETMLKERRAEGGQNLSNHEP
jgi:hypothetical protein